VQGDAADVNLKETLLLIQGDTACDAMAGDRPLESSWVVLQVEVGSQNLRPGGLIKVQAGRLLSEGSHQVGRASSLRNSIEA